MIIKNSTVFYDGIWQKKDVEIVGTSIVAIEDQITGEQQIDAKGKYLLPGLIDVHVHLREPGFAHKETIESGTKAALKGGFTTICAMPNVNPTPDTVEVMKDYQTFVRQHAHCNVLLYGSLTKGLEGEEVVDYQAMKDTCQTLLFSDDGKGVQKAKKMDEVFQKAKAAEVFVVAHLEDEAYLVPNACMHEGTRSQQLGWMGIPSACEYTQLERDLQLVEQYQTKYHACHLSTKESVALLAEAKAKQLPVSGEVCVHHLLLSEDDVAGPMFKMNPPLRSQEDRAALILGIQNGTIEMIVSDHAPHTVEEKAKGMELAPFGIVGLETNFALAYTHLVKTNLITLEQLVTLMSTNPAKRFGLSNKGEIKVGYDADIILVDVDQPYKIDCNEFVSKGKNTPFEHWEVYGDIVMTVCQGKVGYQKCNVI